VAKPNHSTALSTQHLYSNADKVFGMAYTPPLLLIPGLGASARTYAGVMDVLWSHSSVTLVNATQQDSIAALATHILADAPPHFALIGHSMGGYVAFEILRQAPQRVLKLALLNTSARADSAEAKTKRIAQIEKAKHGAFAEIIIGALPAMLHAAHSTNPLMKESIIAAFYDAGMEGYVRQQTAIMDRTDSRPDLASIRTPTLVLTGDGDTLVPMAMSQEMAAAITDAELVVIPQSGHMAALEQPEAVSVALAAWLTR
jgi:pimeloyl-ACP methyl ester carboxylesterase